MSELCRRKINRLQLMIMKKSAFMLLIILLSLTKSKRSTPYRNEDGKKIDKEELKQRITCRKYTVLSVLSLSIRQKWLPVVSKYATHASALPKCIAHRSL